MIEIILTKEQLYYLDETFKEVLPREVHLTVETVTFKQSIQLFRKVDDHEKAHGVSAVEQENEDRKLRKDIVENHQSETDHYQELPANIQKNSIGFKIKNWA